MCLNVGVDVLMMMITDYVTCDEWHFWRGELREGLFINPELCSF